jgi:hypothetical protein
MRVFGFEIRRASETQMPQAPPQNEGQSDRVQYAFTPEAKVRKAYRDAGYVLEHLMRGLSASREMMARAGVSNRRWRRAVWLLAAAGVISFPRERQPLELVATDWASAEEQLDAATRRILSNLRNPNYTLPVE